MLSSKVLEEIKDNLPRIAALLGTHVDNLYVLTNLKTCSYTNIFRDKVIHISGLDEELPPITYNRNRNRDTANIPGCGIFLYQNYLDPELKYIHYCTKINTRSQCFFIVEKNKLYRLQRNLYRTEKMYYKQQENVPLFLDENLLKFIKTNTIDFIANRRKYNKYETNVTRGIILYGKPGNGKTQICRYLKYLCTLSNSIDYNTITSTMIDSAYTNGTLDKLFNYKNKLIFFDDIDISYFSRTGAEGKKACAILAAMDGINNKNTCCRIFTTNEDIDDFDPAFYRPGRIDVAIHIKPPERDLRSRFIESWHKDIISNINIEELVNKTNGYSFADLEGVKSNLVLIHENKGIWDLDKALDLVEVNKAKSGSIGF